MQTLSKKRTDSVDSSIPIASSKVSSLLIDYLNSYYNNHYDELLILCIGTDRSTGDCLGPLTGYKLFQYVKNYEKVHVIGTLDEPVHAKNLSLKIDEIKRNYNNPFIVAIDACLGNLDRIGYISLTLGPLKPGAGVKKSLPSIGDMHITGVVNLGGFMEYVVLQNTRLNIVMKMSEVISSSFNTALWHLNKNKILNT